MKKLKIVIGYLYGDLMNIYGDTGNIIALKKRAQWRGIEVIVKNFSIGNKMPKGKADLFFFGGGQDQAQASVASDLGKSDKGRVIREEVERGVPLLSICGGYQLLGEYYKPHKGPKLLGAGLFPSYTLASFDRMIGNIVVKLSAFSLQSSDKAKNKPPSSARFLRSLNKSDDRRLMTDNYLVGFENHSGKTFLKEGAQPLARVIKGFGNNGEDKTEGCVYKNAIGCYMHGSLLPKNPHLADWLLTKALGVKYGREIELKPLDDSLELKAHQTAISKFG